MKRLLVIATALLSTAPTAARAQEYLLGADATASSGIEGGGTGFFRTRTRLQIGADLRVDEWPDDVMEVGLLAEVEPRSGFGGYLHYGRVLDKHIVVTAGVLAILAPASLYGACAGLTYRLPLSKHVQVVLGPELDFYFLGSDLPDGTVIWQVRVQGGFRVDL
jgi:hypothetical protein